MTKLILVRHCQSMGNMLKIFTGQTDIDLTELGKKQAELLCGYLESYNIDKIYSSDLVRAYNTALPTAKKKGIEIIKDKNLREIDAGIWEKMPFDEIEKNYKTQYGTWLGDIGKAACPGGESVFDLKNRIEKEISKIVCENEGKTVMVVSHGTPIRAMFCIWNGIDIKNMSDISWVANASVSVAEYENPKELPKITLYGYCDYLKEYQSTLPANV